MSESPSLTAPVFEHHHNGLGLNTSRPRISWRFIASESTTSSWYQTAYEIEITPENTKESTISSLDSAQSILVPWPADPLPSRTSATVRVRAFGGPPGESAQPTAWSSPSIVETALLETSDWTASFITAAEPLQSKEDESLRPLWFKKQFILDGRKPSKARLYITALGVFNAYINAQLVSDECMAPGWTSYHHRLAYRVYDVTSLLNLDGPNTICVEVGEGWYAGRMGFRGGKRFNYGGEELGLLAQLEVHFEDPGFGSELWKLESDTSWICTKSARVYSEIYNGELYDMREEKDVHRSVLEDHTGSIDKGSSWFGTKILTLNTPHGRLVSLDAPPVRVVETLRPVKIFRTPKSKLILDFGQNIAGKIQIKSLALPLGGTVTFSHAEVLDEHGELGTRPLRSAKATDTVISSGKPLKNWTPAFTYHGFRYVQVDGWDPNEDEIVALVMQSDMRRRGFFTCSNKSVNQLHSNILWSMRGNFLFVPSDCPSRDERMGWTGDTLIFTPTANFLYDTTAFLNSWLEDVQEEQLKEGAGGIPPLVAPDIMPSTWRHKPQGIWGDAVILIPYILYTWTGDKQILERQYAGMRAWLDQGVDREEPDGLWNPDVFQFADWLDPSAPPNDMANSTTDSTLVVNAYLIHSTDILSRISTILDNPDLATKYAQDHSRLKTLFQHKYITPSGNILSNTQTALSLAIQFSLYASPSHLKTASSSLHRLVRSAKFNIRTGFVGTALIAPALTKTSNTQLAYRMLLEKTCPSWMYPITMGATTIWERWDSMLADGRINEGQMTSFNHFALGSVGAWIHGSVGGIEPSVEEGWRNFRVRPVPGGNLRWARIEFDGPYGLVKCRWDIDNLKIGDGDESKDNTRFKMELVVPPNSSAMVTLPDGLARSFEDTDQVICVGSGTHRFECKLGLWKERNPWPPTGIYAPWDEPDEQIAE